MPYRIEIRRRQRLGIITFEGPLTGPELARAIEEVRKSDGWQTPFHLLWDGRAVTAMEILPEDVAGMRETLQRFGATVGPGRSAWVFTPGHADVDMIAYLLARAAPPDERERRGFTTVEAALAWIAEAEEGAGGP